MGSERESPNALTIDGQSRILSLKTNDERPSGRTKNRIWDLRLNKITIAAGLIKRLRLFATPGSPFLGHPGKDPPAIRRIIRQRHGLKESSIGINFDRS